MARKTEQFAVGGRRIAVSNLDKILFPGEKFSKAHVIDYYVRISKYLLPHLRNHPVTLKRFPEGVFGQFFYEKDAPAFTPAWVKTVSVPRRETPGPDIRYILINDLPTLVWLANLANLEIHPFLHRAPRLDRPASIVFDCDPGEGANILDCARVALMLREVLHELKLDSYVKVSGSKGLQVYVPLNSPITYAETQPLAKALAELLAQQEPKLIVSEMPKRLRTRKVFIDWSQNAEFKTTVSVYSLRAKTHRPYVSLPVEWTEIETALKNRDADSLFFTPHEALERVEQAGDLFKPLLKQVQKLPADLRRYFERQRAPKSQPADTLKRYVAKRNFRKTAEPAPGKPQRSRQGSRRRFVIQKHAASHLHYDFRLEMHGVLKSWSVPKGPPLKKDEKRLAMPTEDHPIEYLDFEGIIPKGQYGGGTVMVWDIGTYELIEGNYYKGMLRFYLNGAKLKGEWTIKRLADGKDERDARDKWQLIKTDRSIRAISKKGDDESALTKRTMKQIASSTDARPKSNHVEVDLNSLPEARLDFIKPMLARVTDSLPVQNNWLYELKLDGYRTQVMKKRGAITLFSRRGNIFNHRFSVISEAFDFLPDDTIVDGEVVALDDEGKPSFSALQNFTAHRESLYFYAFDLLVYQGKDLRNVALSDRRTLLKDYALRDMHNPVRFSETFKVAPTQLIAAAKKAGLEGVVAKRAESKYESGDRSGAWLKYKTNKGQELVIGGYKPGSVSFDYLLAGYYEGKDLIFIGKIKNGFTPALRRKVAENFEGLRTTQCPFANLPEPKSARRGEAITAEVMGQIRWLRPKLVAQIEFTEWTEDNHLRHSKFIALRDDKKPTEVTKERW